MLICSVKEGVYARAAHVIMAGKPWGSSVFSMCSNFLIFEGLKYSQGHVLTHFLADGVKRLVKLSLTSFVEGMRPEAIHSLATISARSRLSVLSSIDFIS